VGGSGFLIFVKAEDLAMPLVWEQNETLTSPSVSKTHNNILFHDCTAIPLPSPSIWTIVLLTGHDGVVLQHLHMMELFCSTCVVPKIWLNRQDWTNPLCITPLQSQYICQVWMPISVSDPHGTFTFATAVTVFHGKQWHLVAHGSKVQKPIVITPVPIVGCHRGISPNNIDFLFYCYLQINRNTIQ